MFDCGSGQYERIILSLRNCRKHCSSYAVNNAIVIKHRRTLELKQFILPSTMSRTVGSFNTEREKIVMKLIITDIDHNSNPKWSFLWLPRKQRSTWLLTRGLKKAKKERKKEDLTQERI